MTKREAKNFWLRSRVQCRVTFILHAGPHLFGLTTVHRACREIGAKQVAIGEASMKAH